MKTLDYNFYQELIKPDWAPPSWLFGPVWMVLYLLIAISYGTVFYKVSRKQLPPTTVIPFLLNLFFNFAFTPIQFGLKNNLLAAIDVLLVLATLLWALLKIFPRIKKRLFI